MTAPLKVSQTASVPLLMTNHIDVQPAFLFQINEVCEQDEAPEILDTYGRWVPTTYPGHIEIKHPARGISNQWWYFNGHNMRKLPNIHPPEGVTHYKTFSMFFSGGLGFYVLRGNATNPPRDEAWHALCFDYNPDDYSSFVCNAGDHATMRVHNPGSAWQKMLLPSIYHGPEYQGPGGLTGDLPIFLGLVAFSMRDNKMSSMLPALVQNGQWQAHDLPNGQIDRRGVVVSVYAYNRNDDELEKYEEGNSHYGKYYY